MDDDIRWAPFRSDDECPLALAAIRGRFLATHRPLWPAVDFLHDPEARGRLHVVSILSRFERPDCGGREPGMPFHPAWSGPSRSATP